MKLAPCGARSFVTQYPGWAAACAKRFPAKPVPPASSEVWVAPRAGTISIRGHVLKSDSRGGSGVYAAIDLVSGKDVTRIWPAKGGKQLIAGNDQAGYSADVNNISVAAGDQVRFEVTANGDNAHDTVSWTPSVGYVVQAPRLARLSSLFAFAKLR